MPDAITSITDSSSKIYQTIDYIAAQADLVASRTSAPRFSLDIHAPFDVGHSGGVTVGNVQEEILGLQLNVASIQSGSQLVGTQSEGLEGDASQSSGDMLTGVRAASQRNALSSLISQDGSSWSNATTAAQHATQSYRNALSGYNTTTGNIA